MAIRQREDVARDAATSFLLSSSDLAMAMPLRTIPPATAAWREDRRGCPAKALLRYPNSSSALGLSSQPKKTNGSSRFLRPILATSEPPRSTSVVFPDELTRSLERVEVFDLMGKAVPITDLWKERKAVVAFARHFGCVLCRRLADLLASKKEFMDRAGVALVLIGPGSVDQAKTFSEQTKFKGEIYADPSHSSFDAFDFAYGVSTTFTPSAGMKILQSYMEGYRQDWGLSFERNTRTRGGWQQGGIIVAGPGISNISYIHKDKEAGDDPDMEDVLRACCS